VAKFSAAEHLYPGDIFSLNQMALTVVMRLKVTILKMNLMTAMLIIVSMLMKMLMHRKLLTGKRFTASAQVVFVLHMLSLCICEVCEFVLFIMHCCSNTMSATIQFAHFSVFSGMH